MTIKELKKLLDDAIERGINPDCAVVVDATSLMVANVHDWGEITAINDPSLDDEYLWYTLVADREADSRFTEGHVSDEPVRAPIMHADLH